MVLDRSQGLIDFDTTLELLDDFSFQSSVKSFLPLNLSSGKFPASLQMFPRGALTDQNPVIPDENGTNHFQHGRRIAYGFNRGQESRSYDQCP
tara:strand:+ start:3974 stop:4252 length:279 start_codon:yes stop_codon:yes gene_type:complete